MPTATARIKTILCAAFFAALASAPSSAEDISAKGAHLFRHGSAWIPKGVVTESVALPASQASSDLAVQKAGASWGTPAMLAVERNFGADTIDFEVEQEALDPTSPKYDPDYRSEIESTVKETRKHGFVAMVTMRQRDANKGDCMPSVSTAKAWRELAPAISGDGGVVVELYAAPCKGVNPADMDTWTSGMQGALDAVRTSGFKGLALADGIRSGHTTVGLVARLHDTAPDRLAMAVRPDLAPGWFESLAQWTRQFGSESASVATVAVGWNATPAFGCVDSRTPELALSLTRLLAQRHIGLIAYAIDSDAAPLAVDRASYKPLGYGSFKSCKDGSASGAGVLLAKFPRN